MCIFLKLDGSATPRETKNPPRSKGHRVQSPSEKEVTTIIYFYTTILTTFRSQPSIPLPS